MSAPVTIDRALVGRTVRFLGYDGSEYVATVERVRLRGSRVARIAYRHPRTGERIVAYIDDASRLEVLPA